MSMNAPQTFEVNGERVTVQNQVDVNEWLAAGFKPVDGKPKKRGRKPKAQAADQPAEEPKKESLVKKAVRVVKPAGNDEETL